jgi:outer membrane protein, multidrug efflux system
MHSLAILLGEDPDALQAELETTAPIPPLPLTVPVGLPSDLLRRRPDIRRAERQLAAATARIGVATADLYPKFTITGLLGLDSTKPEHLFDYTSHYYSVVPGVTWPIFDAGKIQNNISAQDELQRQAELGYQQTVLIGAEGSRGFPGRLPDRATAPPCAGRRGDRQPGGAGPGPPAISAGGD